MRWPSTWKDPSAVDLLKGTAINYVLFDDGADLGAVRARAQQAGVKVGDTKTAPSGVVILKGEWPGVRMSRGAGGDSNAGPTGVPWVDSNGWAIRLAMTRNPDSSVWVDAPPKSDARIVPESYLIALADTAAYGGRWIITLENQLAANIAADQPAAREVWKKLTTAAGFFAAHKDWAGYSPVAVVGVISDFTGDNEFLNHELLNLLARAGQHYRILFKDKVSSSSFDGLRAAIYADGAEPSPALRKSILAFVQNGGMLITVPKWGQVQGSAAKDPQHPRFTSHAVGKGVVAVANAEPDDPYMLANDSVVLVSHRYDLVRFWNGGATGSFYTAASDRKKAVVHLLFYSNRGPDAASVRVAGPYRKARIATVEAAASRDVDTKADKGGLEVHLPRVSQYVALELEA